jgi:UPF0716 family protein affecting phage T7 exclusion
MGLQRVCLHQLSRTSCAAAAAAAAAAVKGGTLATAAALVLLPHLLSDSCELLHSRLRPTASLIHGFANGRV